MERSKKIIQTSIIGIAVNVVLVIFKAAVGVISGSIAVILDAVNNLSDALSSVITIIGTKLAGRAPDKKHPYGHGRIEYLTSMIIAVIVLLAGITSLRESAEKIIHPTQAEYTAVSIIIIVAGIAAKLLVGRYVKGVGEKINSGSLIASGSDALFDSVLSMGTLAAAIISIVWKLSPEGIFGAVISAFIIKAGIEILKETLDSIIGTRTEKELAEALKEKVGAYPEVRGVHDLTLHNYGPTQTIGSLHVELGDDMTAREIHKLTRTISTDVYREFGIILTIGIYASNNSTPEAIEVRDALDEIVSRYPEVLEVHGFYLDEEHGTVTFDLIIDFKADAVEIRDKIYEEIRGKYPRYTYFIVLDSDYSD